MAKTRPTGEQLRFRSQYTGDHILDDYMEASEKGGRAVYDLLDDIFDSTTGDFNADNFEFQFDPSTNEFQVRIGQYAGQDTGWQNITSFFAQRGYFDPNASYQNLDTVVIDKVGVFFVHGIEPGSTITFPSQSDFISSPNTQLIVDVGDSYAWATKTDGQVDSTDYSSKAYAIGGTGIDGAIGSAKDWATKEVDTVDGINYSAKYWATGTNVTTVVNNIADINTAATNITGINAVAGDISNVNITANNATEISAIVAELGTGKDVTTVAFNLLNSDAISLVGNSITSVNTVATDIASVTTVAPDINNVNTAAINIADINAVAPSIADVSTAATNILDINTVAGINTSINTVASINTEVANVSSINTDVTAVAGNSTDITAVANNNPDISTVASINPDISAVAPIAADVNTAATNVADITNFADVYLGPAASDPSTRNDGSALQTGDLYFNTTDNRLVIYDGAKWTMYSTMATQDATNVDIDGGSIDGTTIGATTPAAATFNTVTATNATFTGTGAIELPDGTQSERPATPAPGMVRFNSTDNGFEGYDGNVWGPLGGGATGGGNDQVFVENDQTVTSNYTIASNRNAMTTGPIDVADGVTVTVETGSRWVIV